MARLPRLCLPGIPQHVIQRGTNRQACFASDEDMAAYANWLDEYARKYKVAIHSWVFMTNHVHLLATPSSDDGISRMMQSLGRCYVRYFNHTYQRTGTLWEGRFKSCVVDAEAYLFACQRYIELNPVRAGMVERPEDYDWSSYGMNCSGTADRLVTHHPLYLALGATLQARQTKYRRLFNADIDVATLKKIRDVSNSGLALGDKRFIVDVERLTGRRAKALKRGPRAKQEMAGELLL